MVSDLHVASFKTPQCCSILDVDRHTSLCAAVLAPCNDASDEINVQKSQSAFREEMERAASATVAPRR